MEKKYIKLLSSGFLHTSWFHLILNMLVLFSFGEVVGDVLGLQNFFLVFIASLLGGNLLALYIHKEHGDYKAVGASGAVNGIIFSCISIFPESTISFFFLPFNISAWLFGLVYLLVSLYGIKSKFGNVGHEAHVGGAITGVLLTMGIEPWIIKLNYPVILSFLIPFCLFLILIIKRPEFLLIENYMQYRYKRIKRKSQLSPQEELNMLLDKISQHGIEKLTKKEKEKLKELSEKA